MYMFPICLIITPQDTHCGNFSFFPSLNVMQTDIKFEPFRAKQESFLRKLLQVETHYAPLRSFAKLVKRTGICAADLKVIRRMMLREYIAANEKRILKQEGAILRRIT